MLWLFWQPKQLSKKSVFINFYLRIDIILLKCVKIGTTVELWIFIFSYLKAISKLYRPRRDKTKFLISRAKMEVFIYLFSGRRRCRVEIFRQIYLKPSRKHLSDAPTTILYHFSNTNMCQLRGKRLNFINDFDLFLIIDTLQVIIAMSQQDYWLLLTG